jgi:hypothetical protein
MSKLTVTPIFARFLGADGAMMLVRISLVTCPPTMSALNASPAQSPTVAPDALAPRQHSVGVICWRGTFESFMDNILLEVGN